MEEREEEMDEFLSGKNVKKGFFLKNLVCKFFSLSLGFFLTIQLKELFNEFYLEAFWILNKNKFERDARLW